MKISELIELLSSEICDDYCKYPYEYAMEYADSEEAHEKMLEEVCAECPLIKYT